jgi:hypothetical protein
MIGATCSCAKMILGADICAAAGPWLIKRIPASKMNRLCIAGMFLS